MEFASLVLDVDECKKVQVSLYGWMDIRMLDL